MFKISCRVLELADPSSELFGFFNCLTHSFIIPRIKSWAAVARTCFAQLLGEQRLLILVAHAFEPMLGNFNYCSSSFWWKFHSKSLNNTQLTHKNGETTSKLLFVIVRVIRGGCLVLTANYLIADE